MTAPYIRPVEFEDYISLTQGWLDGLRIGDRLVEKPARTFLYTVVRELPLPELYELLGALNVTPKDKGDTPGPRKYLCERIEDATPPQLHGLLQTVLMRVFDKHMAPSDTLRGISR